MSNAQQPTGQAREVATRLMERIRSEQGFADQIRADPVGVLTGAGLPETAVGEFLQQAEIPIEGDVAGYMRMNCGYQTERCEVITKIFP